MTGSKAELSAGVRGEPLRRRVLDAAERLLRQGGGDFSMRDLAAEAGVSFATPFNQFGSKTAIMHALSGLRIEAMSRRFGEAAAPADAAGRVRLAVDVAVSVMLEEPGTNRVLLGWLGAASASPGEVRAHSAALWALALGDGEGLAAARRAQALRCLPGHLAFAFRGVLSFWTAGELPDGMLAASAREVADALLLGFTEP